MLVSFVLTLFLLCYKTSVCSFREPCVTLYLFVLINVCCSLQNFLSVDLGIAVIIIRPQFTFSRSISVYYGKLAILETACDIVVYYPHLPICKSYGHQHTASKLLASAAKY